MGRFRKWIDRTPWLSRTVYFFPVQLVLVQIKKNIVPLIFWMILLGFVTGTLAGNYGIAQLFVDPEYLGEVGFVSYTIIGFALGGYIMAYQILCYIHNAYRFPFLATTAQPFLKFCINNFIIPLIFQTIYIWHIVAFLRNEPIGTFQLVTNICGYILGNALFIFGSSFYFFRAGKHLEHLYDSKNLGKETPRMRRVVLRRDPISKALQWKTITPGKEGRDWHVQTYLASPWRIRRARPFEHYEKDLLNEVFRQNHKRAVIFELCIIATLLILGLFRDLQSFMIPAGASILLLFTLYLMFTGVLYTWFRGWANTIMILILIAFNYLHQFDLFDNRTRAYGMTYTKAPAIYTNEKLLAFDMDHSTRRSDSLETIAILNNWLKRQHLAKPKLVILNCSGGGLRSALWTFHTMQQLDSLTNGHMLPSTALICGSSGGMLGAAYMREIWLREQQGENIDRENPKHFEAVGYDLLNPMAVSIAVNDWFLPLRHVTIDDERFGHNRAYAFEQQLIRNTDSLFHKRLVDYREPEREALIPMMVFAPTIVNDGRKLVISAQHMSYLTQEQPGNNLSYQRLPDGVEFLRFFSDQRAEQIRFTSVLRMNATFPYVTPLTELPSEPIIEVFDAGMRDNFGTDNALLFMHTFRNWIAENTSGIILVQTRDRQKVQPIKSNGAHTIVQSLSLPLSSFYNNLFTVQNYNQDRLLDYASSWLNCPLDVLDFELERSTKEQIPLSWHLTQREKLQIKTSLYRSENMVNAKRFVTLLQPEPFLGSSNEHIHTSPSGQ